MVNSKKMSKSSIAVIVLAIMLALSMILGVTGAWFTYTQEAADTGASGVFGKVNMVLEIADGSEAKITRADRSTAVEGTTADPIMPGDVVSAATYTLSIGDDSEAAFYVIKNNENNKFYEVVDNALVEITDSKAGSFAKGAEDVTFGGAEVVLTGADYGNGYQGADYTSSTSGYTLYAIQQANLDDATAYTTIMGLIDATFPNNVA